MRYTEGLSNVTSSNGTLASVYGKLDEGRIAEASSSHRLIKIYNYSGIIELPRGEKMLHVIPLQQTE